MRALCVKTKYELGTQNGREHFSARLPARYGGATTGSGTKLTKDEYKELEDILKKCKKYVIFEPFVMFCTDLSLRMYRHPQTEGSKPDLLLELGGDCIPGEIGTQTKWRELTPFSHTDDNKKLLKKYKLEQAESFGYYDY